MEKLSAILKEVEQGKISADHANEQILELFGINQGMSNEEREKEREAFLAEAKHDWRAGRKHNAVRCVRYAFEWMDLLDAKRYCEKNF